MTVFKEKLGINQIEISTLDVFQKLKIENDQEMCAFSQLE